MNVILTRMEGSKRLRHGGEIRKEDSYPIVEIGGIFYFLDELLSWIGNNQTWRGSIAYPKNGSWTRSGDPIELRIEIITDLDSIVDLLEVRTR